MMVMHRRSFLCLPLFVLASVPARGVGKDTSGRVVHVTSGERFKLRTRSRTWSVHLAGVSAPAPGEPYGNRGRQALGEFIFGRTVTVTDPQLETDGTLRGRVLLHGQDVAAAMVAAGHARADGTVPSYGPLEREARGARRGLWGVAAPGTADGE